jgi:cytochrome c oxidase subunit 2
VNLRGVFDQVFTVESAVAGVVFLIVATVLVYGVTRYRAGRRKDASQDTEHPRVEALYAVGLMAVAIALYIYTFQQNQHETRRLGTPRVQVVVTGFQWCWTFHYVTPAPADVTADCIDGHNPTLVLPTNTTVEITTASTDVIHSFWVPHFRYKMDAFPTKRNTFQITIPSPGTWTGHCAEFCGAGHPSMGFTLKAVSPSDFDSWLRTR